MSKIIKGVFFDLLGTLLIYGDMEKAWRDWLEVFFAGLKEDGLTISRAEFARKCDGFFGREVNGKVGDDRTIYEQRIAELMAELGLASENKRLRYLADRTAAAWHKQITLDPETKAVLEKLQESGATALISNFDHPPHVHTELEQLNLKKYFETIVISGEVGVAKPDPRIFSIALRQTGLKADEVVYVGDTDDDVKGAKAAGIRPILIRRDGDNNNTAMDYKIDYSNDGNEISDNDGVSVISRLSELLTLL